MKVIPCPRCRSIRTGPTSAGDGWMHCDKCDHTWAQARGTGSHAVDLEPRRDRPRSTTAAAPAQAPPPSATTESPRPASDAAAHPVAPRPGPVSPDDTGRTPSDYLPETARMSESRALTDRHVSSGSVPIETVEFTPTSSPSLGFRGEPRSLTPRPAGRSADAGSGFQPASPRARRPARHDASAPGASPFTRGPGTRSSGGDQPEPRPSKAAPGGSQEAFDLFDAIEREIEHEREVLPTGAQSTPIHELGCPVCSHRFKALLEQDAIVCPKCGSDVTATARYEHEGAAPPAQDPMLGTTIRGCEVDRKIGEGGMGAVYHARQLSLDRSVAIKVLPPELKRDKKFLKRFEQEAKSLARINHPNIMHVYDFGEDDALGIYFMVMEFVDGLDLAEILRQKRRLPVVQVLDMMRQSALGLQQASDKGVVHRDIKPDNLMVTAEGVWKVSDFGLAKHVDALTQVTRAGIRVGTPAFMSPEQCDGKPLDFRSDIYSLGVTAYVSLSGRLPFDGESPFAIMLKHKTQIARPLATHMADIDAQVDALVLQMLSKDPQERATTWSELIAEMDALLERLRPGSPRHASGLQPGVERTSSELLAQPGQHSSRDGLPPVPADVLDQPSVSRHGGTERAERLPSSDDDAPRQVAAPASSGLPDAGAVGQLFDAFEDGAREPAEQSADPGLSLAPLPDVPAEPLSTAAAGAALARPAATEPESGDRPSASGAHAAASGGHGRGASRRSGATSGTASASGASRQLGGGGKEPQRRPTTGRRRRPGGSSSDRLVHGDDRLRNRMREVRNLERQADDFVAAGRFRQGCALYESAMQRCHEFDRQSTIAYKHGLARSQWRRRRRWRSLVYLALLLLLLAVGLWRGSPHAHRHWAARQLSGIDEDRGQLQQFVDRHHAWRERYAIVFRERYRLPPLALARERLTALRNDVADAARERAAQDLLSELRADVAGGRPWGAIADAARQALPRAEDREVRAAITAIHERADAAYDQLKAAVASIEAQLQAGELDAALAASAELRRDPRLGALGERLPWPVAIDIGDADGDAVPDARILLDGVSIPAGAQRGYRLPGRPVRLEVVAPGYVRQVRDLAAGGAEAPTAIEVRLDRGRAWNLVADVHAADAPWIRIARIADRRALWVHGAGALLAVGLDDGTVLGRLAPPPNETAAAWARLHKRAGPVIGIASAAGRMYVARLERDGVRSREILDCGAPVRDFLRFEASFRAGVEMFAAVVEGDAGGTVIAYEDGEERWRQERIPLAEEPVILHRNARLLLLGRQAVYEFEEDGRRVGSREGSLTLDAPQAGPSCLLGEEHLIVFGRDGLRTVRLAAGDVQADQTALPNLVPEALAMPMPPRAGPVGDGTTAAIIAADGALHLIGVDERGVPVSRWRQELGQRFDAIGALALPPIGPVVADGHGQVAIYARADGRPLHRIDHDAPVLAATVVERRLIVYGADGRLVAYDLIDEQ